ncbi:MAG: copper resistance protein B [Sideroxydans sp.]|jgi:copper resistance protein B
MEAKQMKTISLVIAMFSMVTIWVQSANAADTIQGMDHSSMENVSASPANTDEMKSMDPAGAGSEKPTSMQGGAASADARDPHAYSDGYDFGPIPPPRMADQAYMGAVMFNRLERARSIHNSFNAYDIQGWFGKDYERLVLKAEGEVAGGKLQEARTELLWGHALAAYWNTQLGGRYDSGVEPDQSWLAFGVQGLAPYWFEVDATAYIGEQGHTALRLGTEYELLFTQRLILQPRIEVNLYGKNDSIRGIGSGLSDGLAGLRLRYEFTRRFAPYAGIEWAGKFGETANLVRTAGAKTSETRWVAGVRMWF